MKLPNGSSLPLDVNVARTTTNELKSCILGILWYNENAPISACTDFQSADCYLTYNGQLLNKYKYLTHHNIEQDSTIYLTYRCRGAMQAANYDKLLAIRESKSIWDGTLQFRGTPLQKGHVLSFTFSDYTSILDEIKSGHSQCNLDLNGRGTNLQEERDTYIRLICGVCGVKRRKSTGHFNCDPCLLFPFLVVSV